MLVENKDASTNLLPFSKQNIINKESSFLIPKLWL